MKSEIHAAGIARGCGYSAPSVTPLHCNLNVQAVTPISQYRTRHFFALGPSTHEAEKDETLPDAMFQIMTRGVNEDRLMLEAQQRNLRLWDVDPAAAIRHDRGSLLLRRMMTHRIENENSNPIHATERHHADIDLMSGESRRRLPYPSQGSSRGPYPTAGES